MTRNALLKELLSEYDARRARNAEEEALRLEKASRQCPEIGELVQSRQELIFGGLRAALNGAGAESGLPARMEAQNKRIRGLLKKNGFPEDYLQPVYSCQTCRDTGYVGDTIREMCACLKTEYYRRLYREVGLNEKDPQTFESYQDGVFSQEIIPGLKVSQRDLHRLYRDKCLAWAEGFPHPFTPDLLFTGPSGLGKTFLAHAIAHRVLDLGYNVLMVSAYRVIEIARRAYFQNDPEEMSALIHTDLLVIDDLGAEPMMENITIPQLFNLINERQTGGRSIIFSTNLSIGEIKSRYTERIASRLTDPRQCTVLSFVGDDVRRRGAKGEEYA